MDDYERLQLLLAAIRDLRCDGVAAKLARAIKKDGSYVHRLFYPRGKPHAKGIGTELMEACRQHFDLPRGFWEMSPDEGRAALSGDAPAIPNLKDHSPPMAQPMSHSQVTIPQFETGGAMGSGVVLRDQPGVIQAWRVDRDWLARNVKGFSSVNNLTIVTGFGDSMRPMFNSGDPLLVDIGVKTVDHDGVYFFRVGDEGYIKRLQRIPGEGLRVLSANRDIYEPWTIRQDMQFEVMGRVLKVWKSEDV